MGVEGGTNLIYAKFNVSHSGWVFPLSCIRFLIMEVGDRSLEIYPTWITGFGHNKLTSV